MLDELMFHLDVGKSRVRRLQVLVEVTDAVATLKHVISVSVGATVLAAICLGLLQVCRHAVERHRHKVADVFYYVVLVLLRTVAHLDALELAHLKQHRLAERLGIDLDAIGVARVHIHIDVHVVRLHLPLDLVVVQSHHDALLGIVNVVVVRVVVADALLHVLALLLVGALVVVLHTHTARQVRQRRHAQNLTLNLHGSRGRMEHVADEVCLHVATLVVIHEADAERRLQRVDDILHAGLGEIVAVGIHRHHLRRIADLADAGLEVNRLHVLLADDNLRRVAVLILIGEVLHRLRGGLGDGQLATAAALFQPRIDRVEHYLVVFLLRVVLLELLARGDMGRWPTDTANDIHRLSNLIQVARKSLAALIHRVIPAVRREERQMLQVLHLQQLAIVERHAEVLEQTIQEVQHVEAHTSLRTAGIQYPVGTEVLVLLIRRGQVHLVARLFHVILFLIVRIGDAGIAERPAQRAAALVLIWRINRTVVRLADIRKVHLEHGYLHLVAVLIRLVRRVVLPLLLEHLAHIEVVVRCGLRHARLTESQSLRFKQGMCRRRRYAQVVFRLLRLLVLLHIRDDTLVEIIDVDIDLPHLLANLQPVLQRHVAALQIAYKVVKRLHALVDVHVQLSVNQRIVLHATVTVAHRHAVHLHLRLNLVIRRRTFS